MSDYSESEHSESESETEEVILPTKKKVAIEKSKESDEEEEERASEASDNDTDDDLDDEDASVASSDGEDGDHEEEYPRETKKSKKTTAQPAHPEDDDEGSLHLGELVLSDDEEDEEDEDGSQYIHQFDEQVKEQLIANHHPELLVHNYDEVEALTHVSRDARGIIIDPLHRTLPFLTKYEKTRILGERAKQLNSGAKAFIETNPTIIDGYLIAHAELAQKKIPFILRRPLNNGGSEYWKLSDLEII